MLQTIYLRLSELAKNPYAAKFVVVSLVCTALGFLSGRISFSEKDLQVEIPKNVVAFKPKLLKGNAQGKTLISKDGQCLLSEKPVKAVMAGDELLVFMRFDDAPKILESLAKHDPATVTIVPFSQNPPPTCGTLTRVTYGSEGGS